MILASSRPRVLPSSRPRIVLEPSPSVCFCVCFFFFFCGGLLCALPRQPGSCWQLPAAARRPLSLFFLCLCRSWPGCCCSCSFPSFLCLTRQRRRRKKAAHHFNVSLLLRCPAYCRCSVLCVAAVCATTRRARCLLFRQLCCGDILHTIFFFFFFLASFAFPPNDNTTHTLFSFFPSSSPPPPL